MSEAESREFDNSLSVEDKEGEKRNMTQIPSVSERTLTE